MVRRVQAPAHPRGGSKGFAAALCAALAGLAVQAGSAGCGVDERSFDPVEQQSPNTPRDGGNAGRAPDSGDASPDGEPPAKGPEKEAPLGCEVPADCARPACEGSSCGENGRRCEAGVCACPGRVTSEAACGDGVDEDCDGAVDCADSDCEAGQCGASTAQRCCSGSCVDTNSDPAHCQGCGLACAAGQECVLISDESGVRGHCTCFGSNECPGFPSTICRKENEDGQDDLCACDYTGALNRGCAEGQVCADVPRANFCRYP